MMKKAKAAPLLSSNKSNLKKNAALLPVKPVKEPMPPVPEKPVKPEEKPLGQEPEIAALVNQIKATGVVKNVFCNGFDFVLTRTKKTRLTVDEKVMLEDPLNKIEIKILEMLPEFIRKQADKGGPVIDLLAAVIMISWAKNQEAKASGPREPVKPVDKPVPPVPVKPVNPIDPIPDEKEIKVNVS